MAEEPETSEAPSANAPAPAPAEDNAAESNFEDEPTPTPATAADVTVKEENKDATENAASAPDKVDDASPEVAATPSEEGEPPKKQDDAPRELVIEEEEAEAEAAPPPLAAAPGPAPPPPAAAAAAAAEPTELVPSKLRSASHTKLRAYESKRRSAYNSKLHSSTLYWRSFRDLLHTSLEETHRAELVLKATAKANKSYGECMTAIHDGTVEEDGSAVTDPKRKKKILEERAKKRGSNSDGGTSPTGAAGGGTGKFKLAVSDSSFHEATERRSGILHTLVESHQVLADRYAENAKYVGEELVPELTALRDQLEGEVMDMEKLGDAIVGELEVAEKEVAEAWDAYYAMALKSLAGGGAIPRGRRLGASDDDTEISDPVENCTDVWVVEMQYRMAVAFLSACWDKCSTELSKLFASMKETECSRRFRLRELLVTFLQRQERLWHSLPAVQTPVLKDLIDRPMDRHSIEEDVQTAIRMRAQAIQRKEQAEKKKKDKESPGPGLTGVNAADGNFTLSSPLMSELLCKAKVIERKSTGMMSRWTTTLAVVTADSFLHLFDMPSSVRVTSGSAPEVAFHALVPPVEVPTQESMKAAGGRYAAGKAWYEHLTPSESMVLPNCTIVFHDDGKNSAFEITETVFSTGASKMFGKTSTKKLFLRTVAREETVAWIKALKAPKL